MKPLAAVSVALLSLVTSPARAEEAAPPPTRPEATPPATPLDPPPSTPFQVAFEPRDPAEHWTLRDQEDHLLCELPCMREVPAHSGFQLRREGPRLVEPLRRPVPDTLATAPGVALVLKPKGLGAPLLRPPWLFASAATTALSGAVGFVGFVTLAATSMSASLGAPSSRAERAGWTALGSAISLAGVAGVVASVTWSYRIIREWAAPAVEVSPAVSQASAALHVELAPDAPAPRS